jgi:hypothetical protein
MILRISRRVSYSRAETHGIEHEDTLQQLWIDTEADEWEAQEWRDIPVVEQR